MMTDRPPPGRSTISTVSPLSREAYLLVLAMATSMISGMEASLAWMRLRVAAFRRGLGKGDRGIVDEANAADVGGDQDSDARDQARDRFERFAVDHRGVIEVDAGAVQLDSRDALQGAGFRFAKCCRRLHPIDSAWDGLGETSIGSGETNVTRRHGETIVVAD